MTNIHGQRIGLAMIVKDEAHVITRALDSVRNFVDYYCICDTGSSDDTVQIVENYFRDNNLKGVVHKHAWQNFGHNRTLALRQCEPYCDYVLHLDADEVYLDRSGSYPKQFSERLFADVVDIQTHLGPLRYPRNFLLKSGTGVKWEGVCHEYIVFPGNLAWSSQNLEEMYALARPDGSRSIKGEKYLQDAKLFEDYLLENPNHARSWFYLGQCYYDGNENSKSISAYQKAVELTDWYEERFISYMRMGVCHERLEDSDAAIACFLKAYEVDSSRVEPLFHLIKHYRLASKLQLAALFCDAALKKERPKSKLFLEEPLYGWALQDEISILFYYIGREKEAYDMCLRLLDSSDLPADQRDRVRANANFAKEKLGIS